MSMFSKYDWKQYGAEAIGNNPPKPLYQCEIGKDGSGIAWLCRVKYREQERKFMVWFDKDILTDDGCPFLRDEVIYADNYWQAMRDYHKMALCNYEEIQNVIARFIDENSLK